MRRLNASLLVVIVLATGTLLAADDKPAPKPSPGAFESSQLDPNIKPCGNFYQYVCHNWQLAHPIPPDRSNYGQGSLLTERNQALLWEILEGASKPREGRTALEAKVGTFYNSCMNESLIDKKDLAPAEPYLERIKAIKDKASLLTTLAYLHREGIPGMFSFNPQPDMDNSDLQIAFFSQGGLGLPDRDFYFRDDAKSKETREKYVQYVTNMFKLLGDSPEAAAANAGTVMSIETRLAESSMDRVSMRNPDNRKHPMSFADFKAKVPALDLDTYIANSSVPAVTRVNVVSPKFYEALNITIDAVPPDDWKPYLRFRVLSDMAPRLPRKYEEEVWSFYQKYLTGAKEMQPRWKKCVSATDNALGDALGQLYVAKTFGPEGKKKMAEMIENLRKSLEVNINQLEWMSPETRTKALKKLAAFSTKKVGHPEKWKDYSSVKVSADDFAGNSLRAYLFERKRNFDRIGGKTDKEQWGMTPPTVNAYYSPPLMEVVFPAGILQPPYFDRFGDDAYNYGGIGSVIGHEFSHGFDDAGRKYDDRGNAKDWWTDADAKAFELRANAMADQYSAYKAGGINVNGKLTLGENIGDNGGIRISYMAYRKSLDGKEAPVIDGLTGDQRFFVGWANAWCNNATEDALRTQIQTNPHSPSEFRAIGPLLNMQEFQKAFDCQKGDAMVPEKPVRVW
jgi:putative endopeptidase